MNERTLQKLDAARADFEAGIEPLVREENDRRFLCISARGQKRVIQNVLLEARGDHQTAAAILYCDLGISHSLAEKLVSQ